MFMPLTQKHCYDSDNQKKKKKNVKVLAGKPRIVDCNQNPD